MGWPGDIGMTDEDGDGIYSIALDLPAGDFKYKYILMVLLVKKT